MIAPLAPIPFAPMPPAHLEPEPVEESIAARQTLLPWAIKVSLILTVLGFGTSFYLSRTLPGSTVASVGRDARMAKAAEPETTGSIAGDHRSPREVRLDPCNTNADLRLR